jgi:hypothetical protein
MTPQPNKSVILFEEWKNWLYERMKTDSPRYSEVLDLEKDVADWWLSALSRQKAELVEKIKKAEIAKDKVGTFKEGYDCLKAQFLTLLTNEK